MGQTRSEQFSDLRSKVNMKYVHSLVKISARGRMGWCAPIEIESNSPQYVSFVIPEQDHTATAYKCEIVTIGKAGKRSLSNSNLVKVGNGAFRLLIDGREVWFHIRPVAPNERRLSYVGKLSHPDFTARLTEIEPERQSDLDKLCEETGKFIIGCDALKHYSGVSIRKADQNGAPKHFGYEPLWSFANQNLTLASRLLNFICSRQFPHVRMNKADFQELQRMFKRDEGIRYSWGKDSRHVELIATRLQVHHLKLREFLEVQDFDPEQTYKPLRPQRNAWIENVWKKV